MTGALFDFLNAAESRQGNSAYERIQLDPGAFIFLGMVLSPVSALLEEARHIIWQAPFRHLVITAVPDGLLCVIRQIRQQHISASEITDPPCGQMTTDGTALTITHDMEF